MTFFNYSVPPLRRKQINIAVQDLEGLWHVQFPLGKDRFYSKFYTCLDRTCLLWSLLLIPIFGTAQFFSVSWMLQAGLWSTLSLLGTAAMVSWTYYWVKIERLTWVLYGWVILMLLALLLTDLAIFLSWGKVLANLCPLWLGMSGIGYFGTGFAVRSRALLATSLFHVLGIFILPYTGGWYFLFTGTVMVFSLLVLAELQWDMRQPINTLP
ncbi:hypothetical protein Osc7112_3920 [Oscillatoria nigro-viridis PCC 7112]|uniref:Uncharacterized protein n=1 Tax=Phormidium nigroviride PCC 7112 TaxID=179408 RepID=K9VL86_9CYAN|nr:hypothetical protein [Oscillatoria nigro-viridis]AFZ08257.1 hypothetical protein Osc7112_3920 [Oscillatoria nigro-viridis PCC 7112]